MLITVKRTVSAVGLHLWKGQDDYIFHQHWKHTLFGSIRMEFRWCRSSIFLVHSKKMKQIVSNSNKEYDESCIISTRTFCWRLVDVCVIVPTVSLSINWVWKYFHAFLYASNVCGMFLTSRRFAVFFSDLVRSIIQSINFFVNRRKRTEKVIEWHHTATHFSIFKSILRRKYTIFSDSNRHL